jgi:gas vesicle protein
MKYEYKDLKYPGRTITGVLVGVLVGGLAGAAAMLLLAPHSGKDTRRQIREKGIELRDRTSEIVEDTFAQVRTSANKFTRDVRTYGHNGAAEQLDDASEALQARKRALAHS